MSVYSFKFKGTEEMLNKIRAFAQAAPDKFGLAMRVETEIEATECKRRCPVDITPHAPHPGNLRNSIHVEGPFREGRNIRTVIATGAQAPYGVYVHENLDAHHPVGEAKFIERPLFESRPYMAERVVRRYRSLK